MQVFISTTETQGRRKNDFCFVPDGELVRFGIDCDVESVDGSCGCTRSMTGLATHKGTTTMKVVDLPEVPDEAELAKRLAKCAREEGWFGSNPAGCERATRFEAKELARLAGEFLPGTVLERRGKYLRRRQLPQE